jgi:hypothetical protein
MAFLFLILLPICASACSAAPQTNRFQLFILKQDWHELDLGYDAQGAFSILEAIDTSDNLFIVSLKEIEVYDWERQTITLTEDATQKLASALVSEGELGEEATAMVNMRKSLGWGNPFEHALYAKAFVVRAEGDSLYGGIFLDAVSQMAIDYPVARVTVVDGKAMFALLPIHIPFVMIDPVDGSGNARELSVAEEAKGDVQQLDADGFLTEWIIGGATSNGAVELRSLIRDKRVKDTLDAVGKLKE